jgi:hypothetical protein
MKNSTQALLDEAFREFDTAEASDEFESRPVEGEEEIQGEDESLGEEEEAIPAPIEGDEEAQGEFQSAEEDYGEDDENEPDGDEGFEATVDGEDDENEPDGDEHFSLDENESDDDDDDDVDAGVYASVEEIEADILAIAHEQHLNEIPKGVTASEKIDFMINAGALIELTPITASERTARHAAFAADDSLDGEDEIEDTVEAPVDENAEPEVDEVSTEEDGLGEYDGIDLSNIPETEDDEGNDEDDDESEGGFEPSQIAHPAEAEDVNCEGDECNASVKTAYHPVADAELIATASAADVQMVYSETSDPRWNVIIAGVPAACIKLSTLEKPEAARASFASETYCQSVTAAMQRYGVSSVLSTLKAEFFANSFKSSELANEIRASVQDELGSDYTTRVVAMREILLDRTNLVVAGMSKGFFSKLSNPLFAKAKSVLEANGVHPMAVEAAALEILSAAPAHFAVATEKAVDLMDKSEDTVEDLRENIDDTATRAPVAEPTTASFSHRLAEASLTREATIESKPKIVSASVSGGFDRSKLASLVGTLGRKH